MTIFIVACVAIVLAALAFVAWPLLKLRSDTPLMPRNRHATLIVLALAIPIAATAIYVNIGHWNWQAELANSAPRAAPSAPEVEAMVAKLESRLRDAPNDVTGWLMLGRSYMTLDKSAQGLSAYQKAYDLDSNNVEAAMGLGEALIVADERAIVGKAGELFESVLAREPDNPKALWYGAVGALAAGNLPRAHERLQHMLGLNPPENIRTIIQQQLRDIEQQLSASAGSASGPPKSSPAPKAAQDKQSPSGHALAVEVSLAPDLAKSMAKNLDPKTPLFVLARDPAAPGPPLAAVRRAVGDLPLSVTITDDDAMMQGRGINSVSRVQVVARISKSGTPQAQPGDLYGDVTVDLIAGKTTDIKIVIDRIVAK